MCVYEHVKKKKNYISIIQSVLSKKKKRNWQQNIILECNKKGIKTNIIKLV